MGALPITELFIDADIPGGANCCARGLTDGTIIRSRITIASGDKMTLRVFWRDYTSGTGASFEWDSGITVSAVVVTKASLSETSVAQVAAIASFTKDDDEATPDPNVFYDGVLDLSAQGVVNAIGVNPSIHVVLDLRATSATERITYRVELDLVRASDGSAVTPAGTTAMVNALNGQIRQAADGSFQFWDYTTSKWRAPVLHDGVLGWDAGVEE